jgi:sulfhydrogenase subunit beta (sulfur reductase)
MTTWKVDLKHLVAFLAGSSPLYAPVRDTAGRLTFRRIEGGEDVDLSIRTDISARGLFQPPTSYYLEFAESPGASIRFTGLDEQPRVILGMRPCDVAALAIADRVFSDSAGWKRMRDATTIVGLLCDNRFDGCFCETVGSTPFETRGMDAAIYTGTDLAMYLEGLTPRGGILLRGSGLEMADPVPRREVSGDPPELLPGGFGDALERGVPEETWERVSFPCVKCRICTYVCPTCHCFTVSDEAFRYGGGRAAVWDSCQSATFTKEASGHNPRESGTARARQRIMHKFCWFPGRNDGALMCTGCGRCIASCPTGRNILEDLGVLSGEVV